MIRTLLLSLLSVLLLAPAAQAQFQECRFAFELDTQSSAYHSLVEQAQVRGGFWRPIAEAPDDVQDIAKFIGRLDVCMRTPDGKSRTLSRGSASLELKSPHVGNCTAALLPGNRLLTNWHCFYDPTLNGAGFTVIDQVRINFGYTSKDLTQTVKTFLVANRELQVSKDYDAMILQIVGGDANEVVGGHIPMLMEPNATPRRALTMIHHPFGDPQQFSAGTCQIDPRQAEVPSELSLLRHRCESAGGSSGSLLLDARTLAVVGLHNTGGLGTANDYNGGHKISFINDLFDLGFELASAPPPPPENVQDPANTALIAALMEPDLDRRRAALEEIIRSHPGTPAAISAQNTLEFLIASNPPPIEKPEPVDPPIVVVKPNESTTDGVSVRPDGSGDFRTIADAVRAAKPGDTIRIFPGRYSGGVDVSKPLTLIGEGDRRDIIWEARGDDVIYWTADDGMISNLTLRQTGGDFHAIDFDGGSAVLERSDISSAGLANIAIHAGANPTIRDNDIHGSAESGIHIYNGGRGRIIANAIFDNARTSIVIGQRSNPLVRENEIRDGAQAGIYVHDGSTGLIEGNEIARHALANLVIADGANPKVRNNVITSGDHYGIQIFRNGKGVIENNDISANARAGIYYLADSDPVITRNKIFGGREGGILAEGNSRGTIEENEVYGNRLAGLAITTGANPFARGNTFRDGEGGGIIVYDNGRGTLDGNDIYGNVFSGIEIATGGTPTVRANTIHDGKSVGILIADGSSGVIENNKIIGNTMSGVEIQSGARPVIKGNEIARNTEAGIFVNGEGLGRIENNQILNNGLTGIEIRGGGSNPEVISNKINGNSGRGVWVYEGARAAVRNNDLRNNGLESLLIDNDAGHVTQSGNLT